jgi:DNA invertase Pin-like site-specific DNA recombinase
MQKYIAYYRVSTQKQGASGLGLEAQQASVRKYASDRALLAEYSEVESGKSRKRGKKVVRPIFAQAIAHAVATGATLLIAKVSRLSRNAAEVLALQDAGVEFICCDMPAANKLTIGFMALLAQHEGEQISITTKAGLQAYKQRGGKLGMPNNLTDKARALSAEQRSANANEDPNWRKAGALAISMRKQQATFREIADALNTSGYITRNGKQFEAITVKRLVDRYA